MGSAMITFAGWLVATLGIFLILLGIGHVAELLSRPRGAPRGFDVIPTARRHLEDPSHARKPTKS